MDKNAILLVILASAVLLAGAAAFVRANIKTKDQRRRRSDKSLSTRERRIFEDAKILFSQGQTIEAAKLLERIGLAREAVNLLQESNQIDEAANILLRMGRPNRAGVIFTRHGKWEKAVECFKLANMPLEVARCARESGDIETAATFFLKAEHFSEAADCFAELGLIKKAARYNSKAGNNSKAIEQYITLIEDADRPAEINFEPEELDFLVDAVARGNTDIAFAQVLKANNRLTDTITSLVRYGNIQGAAKLHSLANRDIDQSLIEAAGISETAGKNLGELFRQLDKPTQAAKVFEKIKLMSEAAQCYEDAGSFKEAARCYKMANNNEKYRAMLSKNRSFSEHVSEPTARLKPSDFAGLEATKEVAASTSAETSADEKEISNVTIEPEELDITHDLADVTMKMAQSGTSFDDATEEKKLSQTSKSELFIPEPPAVEVKAPPAPVAIPKLAVEKLHRSTGSATKKRVQDDEDDLENRGGNLPDERYKVKAKTDQEDTNEHSDMDEVFARSKILYDLKKTEKRLLWKLGETVTYQEGDILLEPNQTPKGIFFVLSGSISVIAGPNSTNEGRREVYPGETFAAHWAFLDELIEARFVTKEVTEVRVISREDLQFLLDNNGTLARKLYKNMTRQIRFDFLTNRNIKGFNQAS
jgi:tetratricopeptide (TPR) repeat protein